MPLLCAQVWPQTFPECVSTCLSTGRPGVFLWLPVAVAVVVFVLECSLTRMLSLAGCGKELKYRNGIKRKSGREVARGRGHSRDPPAAAVNLFPRLVADTGRCSFGPPADGNFGDGDLGARRFFSVRELAGEVTLRTVFHRDPGVTRNTGGHFGLMRRLTLLLAPSRSGHARPPICDVFFAPRVVRVEAGRLFLSFRSGRVLSEIVVSAFPYW